MDIATGLGLVAGAVVLVTLILMGGDLADVRGRPRRHRHLRRLVRRHPDPLSAVLDLSRPAARREIRLHDAPHDASASWSTRSPASPRSRARAGPIGLEKVEIDDPFLAKGIRFVADGYDADFIRDNLERDRDNFLTHLDEGQKIYRAIGDCAPAFGMVGTLIGMVQMFANMTDPSKLGPFMAVALLATLLRRGGRQPVLPADRRQAARQAGRRGDQPHADHRRRPDDPRLQEPDARARDAARLSAREASPRRESRPRRPDRQARSERMRAWRRKEADARRSRLVRDLRRPDGRCWSLLRDAGRVLDPGSAKKLQIVAGSMRDAFGVQNKTRYSGIIEVDGLPTRPKLKNVENIPPEDASATPTPGRARPPQGRRPCQERPRLRARLPPRCARRCRTCRSSPKSPSTS